MGFTSILFWLGIVFVMDGSLAIVFQEKWKKWLGELNVEQLGLIEIGVGLILLGVHYCLL